MHSDKTYFRSAWRVNFLASSRLGEGRGGDRLLLAPPVGPLLCMTRHLRDELTDGHTVDELIRRIDASVAANVTYQECT